MGLRGVERRGLGVERLVGRRDFFIELLQLRRLGGGRQRRFFLPRDRASFTSAKKASML